MRSACRDGRSGTIGVPAARTLGIAAPIGIGRDATQECYQACGIAVAAAAAGTEAAGAAGAIGLRRRCRKAAPSCTKALQAFLAHGSRPSCVRARLPARLARGVAHIARLSKSDALQGPSGRKLCSAAAGRPPLARIRTPVWRPFYIDTAGGTCHRCSGQASGSPIRRGCSPCHPLTHGEIK